MIEIAHQEYLKKEELKGQQSKHMKEHLRKMNDPYNGDLDKWSKPVD